MQTAQFDQILRQGVYRWLHSIDFRTFSITYGGCDREYWAWKTKDFANGTLQGGLAGFLDCLDLLDFTSSQITQVVRCVVQGTYKIQRRNGSFEEAYPFESSYAVTGLVLYFLMYARLKYSHYFDQSIDQQLVKITVRARKFLENTPETHGIISNHIATSELALALSSVWLKEPIQPLSVFNHQNEEGWFQEYEGADPGYQSLLESYFSGALDFLPENFINKEKLTLSRAFTTCFKLPNGSFSGEVGARGTGIFYPGCLGLDKSADDSLWFLSCYATSINSVTPTTVDMNNFVPVFNSWALFRTIFKNISLPNQTSYLNRDFPNSGLIVRHLSNEHLIVSLKNCNWRHLVKAGVGWEDRSVSILKTKSKILSHGTLQQVSDDQISWKASFQKRPQQKINGLVTGVLLRLLSVLFFLLPQLQRILKQFLARYVMGDNKVDSENQIMVCVHLQPNIRFEYSSADVAAVSFGFKSHMASANNFEIRAL